MKIPRTLRVIGGFLLYAAASYLTFISFRDYVVLFNFNWKLALGLTVIAVGPLLFASGPMMAWYGPTVLRSLIERAESRKHAILWGIFGFLGAIVVPYIVFGLANLLVYYVIF